MTWWSSPIDEAAAGRPVLATHGAAGVRRARHRPVGYAAFAFALGVTVGMLVRRTVPAMAITLAVFVAVQIAMPLLVRPHLLPPTRSTVEITESNLDGFSRQARTDRIRVSARRGRHGRLGPVQPHRRRRPDAPSTPSRRPCRWTRVPRRTAGAPSPAGADLGVLRRDNAARLPAAGDLPALQPLLAPPVVRDRDLHRPRPRPRRVLLLADPPPPVLTNPEPPGGRGTTSHPERPGGRAPLLTAERHAGMNGATRSSCQGMKTTPGPLGIASQPGQWSDRSGAGCPDGWPGRRRRHWCGRWPIDGSVRVWWAVAGAPSFGPLGTDLIAFTGWWAVGLCAAAAVVTLGLWAAPWRWPLQVAAWG